MNECVDVSHSTDPSWSASAADPRDEAVVVLDLLRQVREDGAIIEVWCLGAGRDDWARAIMWLHDLGVVDSLTGPDGVSCAPLLDEMLHGEGGDHWEMRFRIGTSTWATPFGDHGGVYFWGGPEDFTTLAEVEVLLDWARGLARLCSRPVFLLPEVPYPHGIRPLWRSDQTTRPTPTRVPARRHRAVWAAPDVDIVAEFRHWVRLHGPALSALGLEVDLSDPPLPWVPGLPEYLRGVAHLQLWGPRRAGQLSVGDDGQVDLHVIDLEVPDDRGGVHAYFDVASSAGLDDALHSLLAATLETRRPPRLPVNRPFVTALRHWEKPATQPWPSPGPHGSRGDGPDPRPDPPAAAHVHRPPAADLIHDCWVSAESVTVHPDHAQRGRGKGGVSTVLAGLSPLGAGLAWWVDRGAEFSGPGAGVGPLNLLGDADEGLDTETLFELVVGVEMHEGALVALASSSPGGRWQPVVAVEAVGGAGFDVYAADGRMLRALRTNYAAVDLPGRER